MGNGVRSGTVCTLLLLSLPFGGGLTPLPFSFVRALGFPLALTFSLLTGGLKRFGFGTLRFGNYFAPGFRLGTSFALN